MQRGGFDCILGNPPYLGRKHLSGTFGYPFCELVQWAYQPTGLSELVVFFLRRIFSLLSPHGVTAFITTNSIKDGDIRKDGLDQVLAAGGVINMAVRSVRWPGRANVVVSLLAIGRSVNDRRRTLDGQVVRDISALLAPEATQIPPSTLTESSGRIYQGSIFLGDGFLLDERAAAAMIVADAKNADVIYSVINGQELNGDALQAPGRKIICFNDWREAEARHYALPFARIEELVKPVRATDKMRSRRERWWQFGALAPALYNGISGKEHCFAAGWVTKYLSFSAQPTDIIFTNSLYIFTTDRWDLFTVVQSTIHEVWARKYSGALETRLRYSPSDCFDTFAFPQGLWQTSSAALADIGERYHEHRRILMLRLWLGLTDVYNRFHSTTLEADLKRHFASRAKKDPLGLEIPEEHRDAAVKFTFDEAVAGILELRRLHVELDNSVLAAYGWHEAGPMGAAINLAHDFYEVETLAENDRTRYTISPTARKELLSRLLKENHARAAAEAASAPVATKKSGGKSRGKKNPVADDEGLVA